MFGFHKCCKPISLILVLALTLTSLLSRSAQAVVAPQATSQTTANNSPSNTCINSSAVQPALVDEETAAKYRTRFLESDEFTQFATTIQEDYVGKFTVQLPTLNVVKLDSEHTSVVGVVVAVAGGAGSSSFSEWFDANGNLTMTVASIFDLLPDGNTIEASIAMNSKPHVHAFVTVAGEIISGTIWHDGKTLSLAKTTINAPQGLFGFLKCLWDCLVQDVPPWYLAIVFAVCQAVCIFYAPVCLYCFYARLGAYLPRLISCWTACRPQMIYMPVIIQR